MLTEAEREALGKQIANMPSGTEYAAIGNLIANMPDGTEIAIGVRDRGWNARAYYQEPHLWDEYYKSYTGYANSRVSSCLIAVSEALGDLAKKRRETQ